MSLGIQTVIVKKTRKEHKCCICTKVIPVSSMCISTFGYDYDGQQVNEKVHIKESCYVEWVGMIDMIDVDDIERMVIVAMKDVAEKEMYYCLGCDVSGNIEKLLEHNKTTHHVFTNNQKRLSITELMDGNRK